MKDLVAALKAQSIDWQRDLDDPYLFHATALGHDISLKIGDFPEAAMFTVLTGDGALAEFDDRPPNWQIPPR